MSQTITEDGEIITANDIARFDGGMSAQIAKAEIESLVATARSYPRSISKTMDRMKSLATMDEVSAAECTYAVPRSGKTIEGPSIRFAEMVSQCWGNSRIISRTTAVDRIEKFVETEGAFLDCETNVATCKRTRRPIADRNGRLYKDDLIVTTANAGQSIALRNAILAGIPKAVWRPAYEAARQIVMGDVKTLANSRAKVVEELQRFGLTADQVFAVLGVGGVEDIDREKLIPLRAVYAQLRNQETTVEDLLAGAGVSILKKASAVNPLKDEPEPAKEDPKAETKVEDKEKAPASEETSESERLAYERGVADRAAGMKRAAPPEWRTPETSDYAHAYLSAWNVTEPAGAA